jgi:chromosome segregation ATPase
MPTKHKSPIIDLKIRLFRAYLASMESLLKDEAEKERERIKELEAEVQDHRKQIKEIEVQLENQTEEEREAAFEKALQEYENSWIDGFYSPVSTADDYYDSPYFRV